MNAAKIGLSSLIMTSLVFAVACADKRGFKARQFTPEEIMKLKGQRPQAAPPAGVPVTAPAPGAPEARDSGTGGTANLDSGDEAALSTFAELVQRSTQDGDASRAAPAADTAAAAGAEAAATAKTDAPAVVDEAEKKLEEINMAALRAESINVIKGKTATLVAKGAGESAKLELGLDALLEVVAGGQRQEISVHGKADLTPEIQIKDKKIVAIELKGKDKTGIEREVRGIEAYASCMSTVETPKDCKQLTVMILVKASEQSKFGAITMYQVNPSATNGLLEKIGSSLGEKYMSFEDARIGGGTEAAAAPAAATTPAPTPAAGVTGATAGGARTDTNADRAEAARAAAEEAAAKREAEAVAAKKEAEELAAQDQRERARMLRSAPAPQAAATPPAPAAGAPAASAQPAQSTGFVPTKNKPHPDVVDTVSNNLSQLKERFLNWWAGDKQPEQEREKSAVEQRLEEGSPFAHGP